MKHFYTLGNNWKLIAIAIEIANCRIKNRDIIMISGWIQPIIIHKASNRSMRMTSLW